MEGVTLMKPDHENCCIPLLHRVEGFQAMWVKTDKLAPQQMVIPMQN